MAKKKRQMAEYRYYKMPGNAVFFALQGERWRQKYEREIDFLHFHNFLEIGFCYSGSGVMTLGEQDYEYHGGDFTVIPSNYLHTTNSTPGTLSSWEYLFIDVDGLMKKLTDAPPGYVEQLIRRINSRAVFAGSMEYPRAAQLIRMVLDVTREKEAFSQEEAEGLILALLVEMARSGETDWKEAEGISTEGRVHSDKLIFQIMDYISGHYSENLKMSDIAEFAHISETHLRRIFSSHLNMSPLEYLNRVRIHAACEYLKKTDDSIALIQARCGFTVSSTFNRNFRRVTGGSPAEWRNRPENYERQILKFRIHSEKGW